MEPSNGPPGVIEDFDGVGGEGDDEDLDGDSRQVTSRDGTVAKGKGKRSIGGGASAGKSSVKSKRALKCLSNANEACSRMQMREMAREERRKTTGEGRIMHEQLLLAKDGHAVIVSAMQHVKGLADTVALATRGERRSARIEELKNLEQLLRDDGREEEADKIRAERYYLLFNPDALISLGGAVGAGSGGVDASVSFGGAGSAGSGAGSATSGGVDTGVTLGGGGGVGSVDGTGSAISGSTGSGVTLGGRGGSGRKTGTVSAICGDTGADDMTTIHGGHGREDHGDIDADNFGCSDEGVVVDVSAEDGARGGFDGPGEGAGSGKVQATQTPRCEEHGVECTMDVTDSGIKSWTCGVSDVMDRCGHFALVDSDDDDHYAQTPPLPTAKTATDDDGVVLVDSGGGRAEERGHGAFDRGQAVGTPGASTTTALDVSGVLPVGGAAGGARGGQGAFAGVPRISAAGPAPVAAQAVGGVSPMGGAGGGQGAFAGLPRISAAGPAPVAAQAVGGVSPVGGAGGGQGAFAGVPPSNLTAAVTAADTAAARRALGGRHAGQVSGAAAAFLAAARNGNGNGGQFAP